MGQRGPVPNLSTDLSRDRDANRGDRAPITKGQARVPVIPEPSEEWHDSARMIWDAALNSGQSDLYQQTDWALLHSLLGDLTRVKNSGRPSGQLLAVIYSTMSSLLLTEGDRRRVRIELENEVDTEDEELDEDVKQRRLRLVG